MKVSKVWATPEAEKVILYCARVSSPHQESGDTRLLRYLVKHKHWSPFEMASMCVEIETSRAMGRQLLRHRSFSFQEFSLRYAASPGLEDILPRRAAEQGTRQGSGGLPTLQQRLWWEGRARWFLAQSQALYEEGLKQGLAKETMRFLLPEAAMTRMYMAGTFRSFLHYYLLRRGDDTQEEHRDIATAVGELLAHELPVTMVALGDAESLAELAVQVTNPINDRGNR